MFKRFSLLLYSAIIIPCCMGVACSAASASDRYTDFLETYTQEVSQTLAGTHYTKGDEKSVNAQIERFIASDNYSLATTVIIANLPRMMAKGGPQNTRLWMQTLLSLGLENSAKNILNNYQKSRDVTGESVARYLLAEHYFNASRYAEAREHLQSITNQDALTNKESDYATLMFGVLLQHDKRHREAISFYQRISEDSYYFAYAQLNAAVAFIRQGWWTDAQLAIDTALKQNPPQGLEEIHNRLLVVLGYSQLKNEFYRNARETFGRVSLQSRYANRALMGIGLSALAQKDFAGALNAFARLTKMPDTEISILESHLMLPYTIDRLGDLTEASTRYSEAIDYFEDKAREMQVRLTLVENKRLFESQRELAETVAPRLASQLNRLQQLDLTNVSKPLKQQAKRVESELMDSLHLAAIEYYQQQLEYLRSYTSQAQYGLAKLYDSQ